MTSAKEYEVRGRSGEAVGFSEARDRQWRDGERLMKSKREVEESSSLPR